MAGTRLSRLIVVFGSSITILALMLITIEPEIQYSVDQVLKNPDEFVNDNLFVRGIVSDFEQDECSFFISTDGNAPDDNSDFLLIDCLAVAIPDGFSEGKMVSIRGQLSFGDINQNPDSDGYWFISAYEIQTGCPSKYEAAE